MGYLRQKDYDIVIIPEELQQIIDTDTVIQAISERFAKAEVYKWLKQKYYLDWEFTNTGVYSQTTEYTGNNRVELNFPAYDPAASINIGALVSNGTLQYCCKVNATTGVFDPNNFYLLGSQYDIWYLSLPYQLFDMGGSYSVGYKVFWKGNVYSAAKPSRPASAQDDLQAVYQQDRPFPNTFPDDPQNGVTVWGNPQPYDVIGIAPNIPVVSYTAWSGVTAYVTGNTATKIIDGVNTLFIAQKNNTNVEPGTDITAWLPYTWVEGDNRDQLIVQAMLHITLYKIFEGRIAYDAISDTRKLNMANSISDLKGMAMGEINEDKLIELQVGEVVTTTSGGVQKNTNVW